MIFYCDTSALIKRYVDEDGAELVNELWKQADGIATSVVAFAESIAAFNRKMRERVLTLKEYARIVQKFKRDYQQLITVSIDYHLNERIEMLARAHLLCGFDAIHSASALLLRDTGQLEVVFGCFDRNLNEAASEEGIAIL
jgi:predicted nucleic acid-binding protein